MTVIDVGQIDKILKHHEFISWNYQEIIDRDEYFKEYKFFEVRLIIPNGGITGCSIVWHDIELGWQCPTICREGFQSQHYLDRSWHFGFAKAAIDDAIANTPGLSFQKRQPKKKMGDQLSLL